jgi:hypothetical protein
MSMPKRVRRNNFRGLMTVDCPACGRFAADRALVASAERGERDLACPLGHVLSWRDGLVQAMRNVNDLAKGSVSSWNETIDTILDSLTTHAAKVAAARRRLRWLDRRGGGA